MKLPKLTPTGWLVLGIAAAILAILFIPVGGTIVAVKIITALRGKREVFNQVAGEVEAQLEQLRPDLTPEQLRRSGEILGALAVHETNGGRTPAWVQGFNFGNVTAGSSWTGPVVNAGDTEPDYNDRDGDGDRTEYVAIGARFRKYASLSAAVNDWLTGVLNWRREREQNVAGYLHAGDADGFYRALHRAGYYTQQPDVYAGAALSIFNTYGITA